MNKPDIEYVFTGPVAAYEQNVLLLSVLSRYQKEQDLEYIFRQMEHAA